MPNQDCIPFAHDLPCDLGEFLSRRRNLPVEAVTKQLGDWLISYEPEAARAAHAHSSGAHRIQ